MLVFPSIVPSAALDELKLALGLGSEIETREDKSDREAEQQAEDKN